MPADSWVSRFPFHWGATVFGSVKFSAPWRGRRIWLRAKRWAKWDEQWEDEWCGRDGGWMDAGWWMMDDDDDVLLVIIVDSSPAGSLPRFGIYIVQASMPCCDLYLISSDQNFRKGSTWKSEWVPRKNYDIKKIESIGKAGFRSNKHCNM